MHSKLKCKVSTIFGRNGGGGRICKRSEVRGLSANTSNCRVQRTVSHAARRGLSASASVPAPQCQCLSFRQLRRYSNYAFIRRTMCDGDEKRKRITILQVTPLISASREIEQSPARCNFHRENIRDCMPTLCRLYADAMPTQCRRYVDSTPTVLRLYDDCMRLKLKFYFRLPLNASLSFVGA